MRGHSLSQPASPCHTPHAPRSNAKCVAFWFSPIPTVIPEASAMVKPTYHVSAEGEPMYHALVLELIKKFQLRRVCDVGGGAHPTLSLDEVRSRNLDYTLL